MMWVRPGMEVRVRLLQHSVGHVACTHWAVRTHRLVTHPLYLELTERGRCALHYHEGAFYPLRTVLEFARRWQDFLYRAIPAVLKIKIHCSIDYPDFCTGVLPTPMSYLSVHEAD